MSKVYHNELFHDNYHRPKAHPLGSLYEDDYAVNARIQREYRARKRTPSSNRKIPLEILKEANPRKDYDPSEASIKLLQSIKW